MNVCTWLRHFLFIEQVAQAIIIGLPSHTYMVKALPSLDIFSLYLYWCKNGMDRRLFSHPNVKRHSCACSVEFSGLICRNTCSTIASELIKYVLLQRDQMPEPYSCIAAAQLREDERDNSRGDKRTGQKSLHQHNPSTLNTKANPKWLISDEERRLQPEFMKKVGLILSRSSLLSFFFTWLVVMVMVGVLQGSVSQ